MNEFDIKYNEIEDLDYCLKLLEDRDKEIERLKKIIFQRENKWGKWTTEKTILSTKMSDYLCKYQNIKREYTKQIKISTDRKKEIERLGNELQVQIEDNTRLNEYIEVQDKKLQQKESKEKEIREYIISNEWGIDYEHSSCRTRLLEILDKDITKKSDCNYGKAEKENK